LEVAEEQDFRRKKLSGRFTEKILYRWNDGKFEKEYLRKMERNWWKWNSIFLEEKP